MKLFEDLTLYKGIFWIVDEDNISNNSKYCFKIPSDLNRNIESIENIGIAKNGDTYNHKLVWSQLPNSTTHKKPYNYYPRGRVEIHQSTAKIFLNGNINYDEVINFLKKEFNLITYNGIERVIVIEDNSNHYLCYLDKGWKPARS